MADMVFRPRLIDIDSEREVILEEIAMYEDDPQEKVFDLLGEAVFGDDPLGRAIIGRAEVISDTPRDQIAAFHADALPARATIVIAAAGAIDHDALVSLCARPGSRRTATAAGAPPAATAPVPRWLAARPRFERKDTEQFHVCLGGARALAPRRPPVRAAACSTRSSAGPPPRACFRRSASERGLAYAVYSFTSAYHDTGQVGLYVGTRADNLHEALSVVGTELERLRAGAGDRRGAAPRQGEPQGSGRCWRSSRPARG